jgi:hypothetical protein
MQGVLNAILYMQNPTEDIAKEATSSGSPSVTKAFTVIKIGLPLEA